MAKNRQLGKLRITTWILTLAMLIAACSMIFVACNNSTDDDDETDTPSKTDTQTFANANFEFFDDNSGAYLIATPDSWSLSTQGSTSLAKSGIVDTSVDWAQKFVYARTEYEKQQDEDNTEDPPEEYYTDIDSDYDVPGWDIANATWDNESEDLTYENLPAEDINAVNPGTHYADESESDTHVLMLHNYRSNLYGTAARYSSSAITLSAGTAVSVSVWVKTYGLTYNENTAVNGNRGAYIEIANTVGGTEQAPIIIGNIDTQAINPDNENNGWVQYTLYLNASSYATTTFTVYLGLGRTNAVSDNNFEYVQGYAFFDDLSYEVMTSEEYAAAVSDSGVDDSYFLDTAPKAADTHFIDSSSSSYKAFALDLDTIEAGTADISLSDTLSPTETVADAKDSDGNNYTLEHYLGAASYNALKDDSDANRSGVKTYADLIGSDYPDAVSSDFERFSELFGENAQILMLYSGKGMPYTQNLAGADTNAPSLFTLDADSRMMIRFWVKTSEIGGGTGATVSLINYDTTASVGAVDTTTLDTVDLKDDNSAVEDIFDGWQLCTFFVTNDTDESITFSLRFNFGPTDIVNTAFSAYADGYAAFTGFEYAYLNDTEYELASASTSTYAVEAALETDPSADDSSVVFDDPAYSESSEGSSEIENAFADLCNYAGVYGNSGYVGGEDVTTGTNEYENAGLLNKKYAANYFENDAIKAVVNSYTDAITASITANNWWNTIVGTDSTQPLLIVKTVEDAADISYGFVGGTTNIGTSSYGQVNLRLKLSANAVAYVYLIDTSTDEDEQVQYRDELKYASGFSYRYDEDGNVVTVDPDDDAFDKDTDILFYKQSNGLWSTTSHHQSGTYYANLQNYETDTDGNLVDADGNIIYYKHNDSFYRYYDEDSDTYSTQVTDFRDANVDADRLEAATLQDPTEKVLSQVIYGSEETVNKWIYVNFFIATGNESKDYRLEVWMGSRDGEVAMLDSGDEGYVIFDQVSYDDLDESTFTDMLEESLLSLGEAGKLNNTTYTTADAILEAYREDPSAFINETAEGTSLIYYHYSLYDHLSYAPYDEDNEYETRDADPYADYDETAYTDEVAYLRFNANDSGYTEYNTFVNYSANEIEVAASSSDSDDETTDSTDNTSDTNLWLLIPSIILAAALFVTLIALLLKKLLGNMRKNKIRTSTAYDARRTRYIRKLKLSEEAADESEEPKTDDVLPDEDEISEEEIYKVEDETSPDEEDPYGDEKDDTQK